MSNSGNRGQRQGRDRPIIEHPLIVAILGGMVVAGVLALIKNITKPIGTGSYTSIILLAVGVIALIGGLTLLFRYRGSMNAWQYTSIAVLVLAGSALIVVTARSVFSGGSSGQPKPKHTHHSRSRRAAQGKPSTQFPAKETLTPKSFTSVTFGRQTRHIHEKTEYRPIERHDATASSRVTWDRALVARCSSVRGSGI